MNRLLFLVSIPFFEDLSLEELTLIDESLSIEEFLKDETIFEEGDRGEKFYMIFEGLVGIYIGPKGNQKQVAQLKPGNYFGEMALFESATRSATAITLSPCRLLTLGREHFQSLVIQRPEILLRICKGLCEKLREMNHLLGDKFQQVQP